MSSSLVIGTDRPPLILIVEDHADTREMYVQFLAISGFRTAEAGSGQEAIGHAAAIGPSLIVTDLSLPGFDGCEVIGRLKADEQTRDIPIIALTAHADSASADRARQAGCASFLTKPCLPDALVAEIRRLLPGPESDRLS